MAPRCKMSSGRAAQRPQAGRPSAPVRRRTPTTRHTPCFPPPRLARSNRAHMTCPCNAHVARGAASTGQRPHGRTWRGVGGIGNTQRCGRCPVVATPTLGLIFTAPRVCAWFSVQSAGLRGVCAPQSAPQRRQGHNGASAPPPFSARAVPLYPRCAPILVRTCCTRTMEGGHSGSTAVLATNAATVWGWAQCHLSEWGVFRAPWAPHGHACPTFPHSNIMYVQQVASGARAGRVAAPRRPDVTPGHTGDAQGGPCSSPPDGCAPPFHGVLPFPWCRDVQCTWGKSATGGPCGCSTHCGVPIPCLDGLTSQWHPLLGPSHVLVRCFTRCVDALWGVGGHGRRGQAAQAAWRGHALTLLCPPVHPGLGG